MKFKKELDALPGLPSSEPQRARLQALIRFNCGGHVNHSLFWLNLTPQGGGSVQSGRLQEEINRSFNHFDNFRERLVKESLGVQGSGWGWLVWNMLDSRLEIITTANQDPVAHPRIPLLGIDMWEHAYYLDYWSNRNKYLNAIWNVLDFAAAGRHLDAALSAGPEN
ncbi:hypothetical protein FRC08_011711 [Ceratobasidium sp. 394]|nr:hypothetical protein FRC08_011711 [Ceratobasidium sp. 394]KAG9079012.1 hypothetical protein FS749_008913 [Ceratobasidium sp. UAMH 11750]